MTSTRRNAWIAGVLFLVTHVTSVAALVLYTPVLHDTDYIRNATTNVPVLVGAFLEIVLALAIVGTAVALFPVAGRHNEALALGYVALRTLEACIVAVGVVPLLSIVTLRRDSVSVTDATGLGKAMVAFHNWTFLIGPGYVCGVDTVLIAYLLYRFRLVPRFIPVLGLIGGPLVFASSASQMFGLYDQFSRWSPVMAVPVFAWEICLALYLVGRGLRTPVTTSIPSVGSQAAIPA